MQMPPSPSGWGDDFFKEILHSLESPNEMTLAIPAVEPTSQTAAPPPPLPEAHKRVYAAKCATMEGKGKRARYADPAEADPEAAEKETVLAELYQLRTGDNKALSDYVETHQDQIKDLLSGEDEDGKTPRFDQHVAGIMFGLYSMTEDDTRRDHIVSLMEKVIPKEDFHTFNQAIEDYFSTATLMNSYDLHKQLMAKYKDLEWKPVWRFFQYQIQLFEGPQQLQLRREGVSFVFAPMVRADDDSHKLKETEYSRA